MVYRTAGLELEIRFCNKLCCLETLSLNNNYIMVNKLPEEKERERHTCMNKQFGASKWSYNSGTLACIHQSFDWNQNTCSNKKR